MKDDRLTTLEPTLRKIVDDHNETSWLICKWLKKLRTDPIYWDRDQFMRRTAVSLNIRHDNDYIECGPMFHDPKGKMFKVFTIETTNIKFSPGSMMRITKALKDFHKGENVPKGLEHVILNFFSHERKLSVDSLFGEKLVYSLTFKIYHRRLSQ